MNTLRLTLCLSALLALPAAPPTRAASGPARKEIAKTRALRRTAQHVAGELLVRLSDKSSDAQLRAAHARLGARVLREFPALGWQLVRLPAGASVEAAARAYRQTHGVAAAQPNYVYRLAVTPNDPRYASGEQYGLAKIGAPSAWDATTGSASVVVAVVDTGVKYTHEDLQANLWTNPGESGGGRETNGLDDDANGYTDDVHGADTVANDGDPLDEHGHGTHVAGIIGAVGNNSVGVVGVNWNVRLLAVKMFDATGTATTATAIAALRYVTQMRERGVNVRVANHSWGGPPEAPDDDPALREAFRAAGAAGVLNVCAAGNGNRDTDAQPFYPASFRAPAVVSVAASDQSDNRASFSNFGATSVDLAAPGAAILSTLRTSPGYGSLSGTSMSTPFVAGAAALVAAAHPSLDAASLKATLMNTVDALPQWAGKSVTGGRLNVSRALSNQTSCAFGLSATAAGFDAGGGNSAFDVRTSVNCDWTAVSNAPWITINSITQPSGNGSVNFSVAPHDGPARTGTITAAGLTFTVTQSSGCNYSVSPSFLPFFPAAGGQGSITMQTGAGCPWQATSFTPWITITQGSGTGTGTINFTVAPNYGGPARSGQILRTDHLFYTISQDAAPPGQVLISEFRIDGPAGPADEFVELYNNTDEPLTVSTSDGSAGWALVAWLSTGGGPAVSQTVCTIPLGTILPARGHYLCTNSFTDAGGAERGYSLKDYGGANAAAGDQNSTGAGLTADGVNTRFLGLTLFRTATPANFTLANRLDAASTSANSNELIDEGAGINYAGEFNTAAQYSWVRKLAGGRPQDTNENFNDFQLVSTDGAMLGVTRSTLGAPGPENLASALQRNSRLKASLLDPRAPSSAPPNRLRDHTPVANGAAGTLSIRRRFSNRTAQSVTRLRFRIVQLTTLGGHVSGEADLRALTSADVSVTVGGVPVAVRGTTLEEPAAQPAGGGLNSTLSVGAVTLSQPLAPNSSIAVQFLLGVEQTGNFRFFVNVEALP